MAADGRRMHYGDALKGLDAAGLHRMAVDVSPMRDPARYRLIGKQVPRVDIQRRRSLRAGHAAAGHTIRVGAQGMICRH
jgi:hypothetical protein